MTPRLIFARHGQTEWSKTGQHTSITDIPLTPVGVEQVKKVGKKLIGEGLFIEPSNLKYIITSPRLRARSTVEYLLEGLPKEQRDKIEVIVDEDIQEWRYGDYEGLRPKEIVELRKSRGLDTDRDWDIWQDGCENGEDSRAVSERLDRFIGRVREKHARAFADKSECDILVVSHGHISRCLVARWIKLDIDHNPRYLMNTSDVGVLSYQHNNIEEPALSLAGAFSVKIGNT